jgi:ADP-ribose pyrophosphatase
MASRFHSHNQADGVRFSSHLQPSGASPEEPCSADPPLPGDLAFADALAEKIIGSTRAYSGGFLNIDKVEIELPNGRRTVHDVVRHPGAVAVIALDEQGRVLIVHQYRTALERLTREIPAGKLDPGEEALDCARRELLEETGYAAGRIRYLAPIAVASGYSDEIIHLFMATSLEAGEADPDEDEFVACEWVALDELVDDVLDGKLEDSKTVVAILLCDVIARRLQIGLSDISH